MERAPERAGLGALQSAHAGPRSGSKTGVLDNPGSILECSLTVPAAGG